MAADSPEFGQFSEKSPRGHVADARNGFQERLGFAPSWGMLDGVADVVVDRVELFLEIGDVAREPSGERLVDGWAPRLVSMPIILMIWRRRPTSSARWTRSGSRRGRACGRTRSAKRAITSASSVSVLAKRPIARAKSRIWRGLTTQSGNPTPARAAATVASKPPVASSTTRTTDSPWRRTTRAVKFPREGAGLLSSLIETEGLVELPELATLVEPGTMVAFLPYLVLL